MVASPDWHSRQLGSLFTGKGLQMCKSSKVNRRSVLVAVKSGNVTGTDLRSCAVSVVAELSMHPVHVGKVEEILYKLWRADVIELRDAQMRCVEKVATPSKKKFDRSVARKQGRIGGYLLAPQVSEFPEQWRGVDPDEYSTGWVDPAGGWDDDAVFDYHLEVCQRRHEIEVCLASQALDISHDKMHAPKHDFIPQYA